MADDHIPRTFREVAIILNGLKDDVGELSRKVDKMISIVIVSLLCPIIVAVVVAILIKNSQ